MKKLEPWKKMKHWKKLKPCRCQYCLLGKTLTRIAKRCTPKERKALDELWTRMETAETDLIFRDEILPGLEKEGARNDDS